MTASGVYQVIERRGQEAGVEVNPHKFRHTFSHVLPRPRRRRRRLDGAERVVQPAAVIGVAMVAAAVSYEHAYALAHTR